MKKYSILVFVGLMVLVYSFKNIPAKSIIVIDAGHGGKDNGAEINNVKEKDFTLSIAKKIKELNHRKDIIIVL